MDSFLANGRQNLDVDEDMVDFFTDNDVFSSSESVHNDYIQDDWFKNLFDDPVLNDKMITDAAPPTITSEHSYSIDSDIVDIKMEDFSKDLDHDFLSNTGALDLSQKSIPTSLPVTCLKHEAPRMTTIHTATHTIPHTTKTHAPPTTIIITTPGKNTSPYVRPAHTLIQRAHIKVEPIDALDQVITDSGLSSILPLTPPHTSSSSSSDSDGSLSPHRSGPCSPLMSQFSPLSRQSKPFIQPVFTNPIPTTGVLILTEEEKRTLVQEGYPIPNKLPLTKNEEKNLKKIRRKIKNKISAQESRRKKKEYLELLEKQVESYTHENSDLKRKVDNLECSNKSLLGQLQKLQSLVGKYTGTNVASTPSGSILMVVVLCFAVFLGNWAPTSLNIGYNVGPVIGHEGISRPNPIHPSPYVGPAIQTAIRVDTYATPNMKSRMLLSLRDECFDDEGYGPRMPLLNPEMCDTKDTAPRKLPPQNAASGVASMPREARVYINPATENENDTRETTPQYTGEGVVAQAWIHPDIAVPTVRNVTVAQETA